MELNARIKKILLEYLQEEPDSSLRTQIKDFDQTSKDGIVELEHRLDQHLKFGTAGIRGRMQAGYNRMNEASVYRIAFAIGTCLLQAHSEPSVVVAFDARKNSEKFAKEISQVLLKMGISVKRLQRPVATPLCAFATKYENAEIGIMVTASHNPGTDNGIKLFSQEGSQAFGPILQNIEKQILLAPLRPEFYGMEKYKTSAEPRILGNDVEEAYFAAVKKTKLFNEKELDLNVSIAYTALHGVGYHYFMQALNNEGFSNIISVGEQQDPDGAFPTLMFPNPEEPHALDRVYELAENNNCAWVFANDPDADRIQIACKDSNGKFIKLSGNEMGSLLGYFTIQRSLEKGETPLVASSLVSSRMLETIARKMGAFYVDAVTGFSNISHAGLQKEYELNCNFVFAYEEAIGFLIKPVVLDKDGISAGVRFMEIVAWLAKHNISVWQFFDELYLQFGLFDSCQWSQRYDGLMAESLMKIAMDKARALREDEIDSIIGVVGCKKYDLNCIQDHGPYVGMKANIIIFEIKDCFRFIIRPSGTEPKIKYYLELMAQMDDKTMLNKIKSEMGTKLTILKSIFEKIID